MNISINKSNININIYILGIHLNIKYMNISINIFDIYNIYILGISSKYDIYQ